MIPDFDNPHALWLMLLIPIYLVWAGRRRTTTAVRYPSVAPLKRLPRSFRQRFRFVLPLCRALAVALLIVVLARPQERIETEELPSEGIAIAMVVDKSASMGDENSKLMYNGKLALRFDAAKDVLTKFIAGDGDDLKGRPNDLIGLIAFATYPELLHPFSLDHTSVLNVVDTMGPELPFLDQFGRPTANPNEAAVERGPGGRRQPRINPMQFTSLKSAVEYTASSIILLGDDLENRKENLRSYHLQSKVMVLLTDGEPTVQNRNEAPDFPDEETIQKLVDADVKVYFIQILSRERYRERRDGTVEVIVPRGFGMSMESQMVNRSIEEARQLARRTNGEHFLATSGDDIKKIYERIDELETSSVGGRTVFSHKEQFQPYLLTALALLLAEIVLGLTWLRRAP